MISQLVQKPDSPPELQLSKAGPKSGLLSPDLVVCQKGDFENGGGTKESDCELPIRILSGPL